MKADRVPIRPRSASRGRATRRMAIPAWPPWALARVVTPMIRRWSRRPCLRPRSPCRIPRHTSRYRVMAHVLGVPKFGARRRAEEDKERQKHAAIAYDQPNTKVTELPATVVYGKGDH